MSSRSRLRLCVAGVAAALVLPLYLTASAQPAPGGGDFVVDSSLDVLDAAFSCAAVTPATLPGPDGRVTLREALCAANNHIGPDTIRFRLPAGSVVKLLSPLPPLDDDGTNLAGDTAPGYSANTAIAPAASNLRPGVQVDASDLPAGSPVIKVVSGGVRVAGLALTGRGPGVVLEGNRSVRNRIEAMSFGVSLTSSIPPGLGGAAVVVRDTAADLVGGLAPAEGNVMRASAGGVVVDHGLRIKILGNAMESLSQPGIVLSDTSVAERLTPPVLDADAASTLTLVGSGVPAGATIDVFEAGPPGAPTYGRRHLGSFVEGSSSDADHAADGRFTFPLASLGIAAGQRLTATATDGPGNTSPFAAPVAAHTVDSDHDGLPDEEEQARGLNPYSADTDGDGLADSVEECRCSVMLMQDEPPALLEISSVTGRVLRHIDMPLSARPVTGFALGRGPAGSLVGVATPAGVAVVGLATDSVDEKLVALRRGTVLTPSMTGRPASSTDGLQLYVPVADGTISVIDLAGRRLLASVPVGGSPVSLTAGDGALLAATFGPPSPGFGLLSLANPGQPSLLYRVTSLAGRTLATDTVITAPASLQGSRFAVAVGGSGRAPVLALLSPSSAEPLTLTIPLAPGASTATIPVAVTAGPGAAQVSVALASLDGLAGAVVTLDSSGALIGSTVLPGRPAGVAVSGSGGLVIPLAGGQVIRVTAPGAPPAASPSVLPVSPSGVLGLASPSTGTDARNASSGPGASPSVAPGAVPPVVPAPAAEPELAGGGLSEPDLPFAGGSSGPRSSTPASRPSVLKGETPGGLPAVGSGQPVAAGRSSPRANVPAAALIPTGLPAAPGGAFPLPRAVALSANLGPHRPSSAPSALVWLVAVGCAGFLVGALAIQPRPGTLGPRRAPAPAWMDDPQAAFYGPARRWDNWISRPPRL